MPAINRLDSIHERLTRLESRERRWRSIALLLALGSLACVTTALKSPTERLEVQELSLKDAHGATRALLRMSGDQPWLSLYDADGKGRLALCLDERGEGAVHAFQPGGEDAARWPVPQTTR